MSAPRSKPRANNRVAPASAAPKPPAPARKSKTKKRRGGAPDDGIPNWSLIQQLSQTGSESSRITTYAKPDERTECKAHGIREDTAGRMWSLEGMPENSVCIVDADRKKQSVRTLLQGLGDTTTTHFVEAMFADTSKLETYLYMFVDRVYHWVTPYVNVNNLRAYLVYKGGNVLVDYFEPLVIKAVLGAIIPTDKALNALVQRSDADFQFFFENQEEWTQHHDAVKRLLIAAVYDFQNALHNEEMLKDYVVNDAKIFNTVLSKSKVPSTDDVTVKIENRQDAFILLTTPSIHTQPSVLSVVSPNFAKEMDRLCNYVVLPVPSLITPSGKLAVPDGTYVTFNDTLRFGEPPFRASFDLIRLKLNVDVTINGCKYHAPAEMIDISISNPEDSKLAHMPSVWTSNYDLKVEGKPDITVKRPTLDYLVNFDLHSILFTETGGFPWNDSKYKKRMHRYVVGSVILCLNYKDNNNSRPENENEKVVVVLQYVKRLTDAVSEIIKGVISDNIGGKPEELSNDGQNQLCYTQFQKVWTNILGVNTKVNDQDDSVVRKHFKVMLETVRDILLNIHRQILLAQHTMFSKASKAMGGRAVLTQRKKRVQKVTPKK